MVRSLSLIEPDPIIKNEFNYLGCRHLYAAAGRLPRPAVVAAHKFSLRLNT